MTDKLITLQLTATQVGYILAALNIMQRGLNGPQASLVQKEINDMVRDMHEQIEDDTLQGLEVRRYGRALTRPERTLVCTHDIDPET